VKTTALVLGGLALGCGGGGGPVSPPTPAGIQVGGQYATAVTLSEDTCGDTVVQSLPTTVAQTAGQTRFTLTHGGTSYSGTLSTDGSFRTDPLSVGSAGSVLAIAIEGRFSARGFDAVVAVGVDKSPPAADCRYLVRWAGTKQGAPNVIP
jgi:hypothetical protein